MNGTEVWPLYTVSRDVETRSAPTGAEGVGDDSGKPETDLDPRLASKTEDGGSRMWTGRCCGRLWKETRASRDAAAEGPRVGDKRANLVIARESLAVQ